MSIVELGEKDLGDIPELQPVPDGDWRLEITKAEVNTSKPKDDKPDEELGQYIQLRFKIVGSSVDAPAGVTAFINLPKVSDDAEMTQNKQRGLKHFLQCFSLPTFGSLDTDAMVGKTGWAVLKQVDGGQYGMQNQVVKYTKPRE